MKRKWKVPVNGVMYKVTIIKDWSKKTGLLGQCNFTDKTITLCGSQDQKALTATYLHELIHAHDNESGWIQVNGDRAVMELSAEGRSNFLHGVLEIKIKKF